MIKWKGGKEVWLNKKSEGRLGKKWQKRWFVLDSIRFRYSHTEESDARRVFELDKVIEVTNGSKPTEFDVHLKDDPIVGRTLERSRSPIKLRGKDGKTESLGDQVAASSDSKSDKGPRILSLSAESEWERDLWVSRLRAAGSSRKVARDAIGVAVQRLKTDAESFNGKLSLREIEIELLAKDEDNSKYPGLAPDHFLTTCTDADIEPLLAALKLNDQVKELDVAGGIEMMQGGITDVGAKAMADTLRQNKSLTSLKLSNNRVGDEGASALIDAASQNRTLTELDLDRNINITEKGVGQLYAKIAQMGNERFQLRVPEKALMQRALAGSVGVGLREHEAAMLRKVVWPAEVEDVETLQMVTNVWGGQGFEFAKEVQGGEGRFQFGFKQHKNGPCGVLAAVQAELLGEILWPSTAEESQADVMEWDRLDGEVLDDFTSKSLPTAISSILWRCRPDANASVKLVIVDEPMETPLKWECLRVIECSQQSQLQKMVQGVLNIFTGKGGVVLLLYSCVMTRGLQKVWEEAGNIGSSLSQAPPAAGDPPTRVQTLVVLEGGCPFCEQSLVNLFLIGQASPDLNPKEQSAIGFLTYTENFRPEDEPVTWNDGTVVGSNYKTPKLPIWVVHGGSHYTVLLARSRMLLKLADPSQRQKPEEAQIRKHRRIPSGGMVGEYVLEHYNGLPPAGPRLSKLFMGFSFDASGNPIDDDDARRRWSMDIDAPSHQALLNGTVDPRLRVEPQAQVEKACLDVSAVWVKPQLGMDGRPAPPHNFGPSRVYASDPKDLGTVLGEALLLSEPVEYLRWRQQGAGDDAWSDVAGDLKALPTGLELMLGIGAVARTPVPPRSDLIQVHGTFHVSNKRSLQDGPLLFEVALDAQSEAMVLWSLYHYATVGKEKPPSIDSDAPGHKLQLLPGMMPQLVSRRTVQDSDLLSIGVIGQEEDEKWRCRFCTLYLAGASLPEEEYFKRLCALNEPSDDTCKVCNKLVEACGRCIWMDYNKLPKAIKQHIETSDRWKDAETQTMPPILHVVRTRWANAQLRPGPLWPSKGGPTL